MSDQTLHPAGGDLHRLLDDAFVGVELTPDAQDLKEEMRANLSARVADLVAAGHAPADAARQAIAEVGDVRAVLGSPPARPAATRSWAAESERHRVRPRPAFVMRMVLAALVTTAGLALAALGATGRLSLPLGVTIALLGIAATGAAWLVGDPLAQETTTNHPMPQPRAGGYFLASLLAVYGLGLGGLVAVKAVPAWAVAVAALGVAGQQRRATPPHHHRVHSRPSGREPGQSARSGAPAGGRPGRRAGGQRSCSTARMFPAGSVNQAM